MSLLKSPAELVIVCHHCGARYLDPGGDHRPWRCRACRAPLTR